MEGAALAYRDKPLQKRPFRRKDGVPQKRHIAQKYLLSGFAIHAFLAAPIYLYGISVDSTTDPEVRLWPPILYQAIGQICQCFLSYSHARKPKEASVHDDNRNVIMFASVITSLSVGICGCLYSASWISQATEILSVIFYGVFGGIGSSLILSKLYLILDAARPEEDTYVIKTIQLCGDAFCQLFLSFVITSLITLYGSSEALILLGSVILNVIPVSLLITGKQFKPNVPLEEPKTPSKIESRYASLPGFSKLSSEPLDDFELQKKSWRSPNEVQLEEYMDQPSEDTYGTYFNSNGVEIMEIIPEEDEITITSDMQSVSVAAESESHISIEFSTRPSSVVPIKKEDPNVEKINQFCKHAYDRLLDKVIVHFVNPMQRCVVISNLYPATLLQSCDNFSYVLTLTVLPSLATGQHQLKFAEIPFLFSLLAFPWMCFALMTPRFGNSLIKKKIQWHILGFVSKGLGLVLMSQSNSKLVLSLATVFLGFGQAVTMFLQDAIIESGFSKIKWADVKHPIHITNGILMIGWAAAAEAMIIDDGFQAGVGFAACAYFICVVLWYLLFIGKFIFKI